MEYNPITFEEVESIVTTIKILAEEIDEMIEHHSERKFITDEEIELKSKLSKTHDNLVDFLELCGVNLSFRRFTKQLRVGNYYDEDGNLMCTIDKCNDHFGVCTNEVIDFNRKNSFDK